MSEPHQTLRAGPLVMRFDSSTGWLRHLRLGSVEILRAIYPAVRDRCWNTLPNRLVDLRVERAEDRFRLTYDAECRRGPIVFNFRGQITGEPDGCVIYQFEGLARSSFLRNRIGLCVLHPADCAGCPCVIELPNGAVEQSRFPKEISPHQPFLNVRAMTHQFLPGVSAEVRFAGDVFETEDQRNWTDASFKTYSTPLALPFPVPVSAGDPVRQTVTCRLIGRVPAEPLRVKRPPTVRLGGSDWPDCPGSVWAWPTQANS